MSGEPTLQAPEVAEAVENVTDPAAKVLGWRVEQLLDAGFDSNAAFVLALDRYTDDTGAIARAAVGPDERFEVLEITECPDDWAGKVNAL